MSTYQQRDGDGALFMNEERETEQHPNYQGTLTVGGVQYYLSAWIKSSKDGTKKYLSLSARPKVQKSPPAPKAAAEEGFDDDKEWWPF